MNLGDTGRVLRRYPVRDSSLSRPGTLCCGGGPTASPPISSSSPPAAPRDSFARPRHRVPADRGGAIRRSTNPRRIGPGPRRRQTRGVDLRVGCHTAPGTPLETRASAVSTEVTALGNPTRAHAKMLGRRRPCPQLAAPLHLVGAASREPPLARWAHLAGRLHQWQTRERGARPRTICAPGWPGRSSPLATRCTTRPEPCGTR